MTTQNNAVAVKEVYQGMVPLKQIEVNGNFRQRVDQEQLKELTENIRSNGVLVPILLVKTGKDSYRLIAGARRLQAAKAVGLQEIPSRVIEAAESKLDELQLFENLHRADLGPIEEARAFKKLLDHGKHTVQGLAKQVDKSVKYVTRSISLLQLPEKAIKAVEKGVLSPEHGHQILRVPEDKREKLVEYALSPKWNDILPTIHELKHEIEQRMERNLSSACFPKDKEYAGEIACAACPYNTGNQDVLFEGAKTGKCTNSACFTKKMNHFLKEFKEKAVKQCEGIKFVGYGSQGGASSVKGSAILTQQEANSEKIKALIKKSPDKFGFAVLKPSGFSSKNAPATVLVCKDKELLENAIRKMPQGMERPLTREEQEREQFLRGAEMNALFTEAASKLKAIGKNQMVDIVLALNGSQAAYSAVGVKESEDLPKTLNKLPEKDLLKLAWMCTLNEWELDEPFADLGVDVKKIRKETRGKALAQWEELRKEQTKSKEEEKTVKQ
jgi:ParB family chromosome partitioning protein